MNTHTLRLPAAFLGEMKALLGAEYDAYIESFNDPWKPGPPGQRPEAFRR